MNSTIPALKIVIVWLLGFLCSTSLWAQWPEIPIVTLTGSTVGWDHYVYPDGRHWVSRKGADDSIMLRVPVFLKSCWLPYEGFSTFPITSIQIPIQYDSTVLNFVGLIPREYGANFNYDYTVATDPSYRAVINQSDDYGHKGKRVNVRAEVQQAGDSLRYPLGFVDEHTPCANISVLPFVELVFKVIGQTNNDGTDLRTTIIITNDSIQYNGYLPSNDVWKVASGLDPVARSVGGVNNYFKDPLGNEVIVDSLRPSVHGVLWCEIVDTTGWLNIGSVSSAAVDTVIIKTSVDYNWNDTLNNEGFVDIVLTNPVQQSMVGPIRIVSNPELIQFRTSESNAQPWRNIIPSPNYVVVIPFVDNGLIGSSRALITPNGSTPVPIDSIWIRLFKTPLVNPSDIGSIPFEAKLSISDERTDSILKELIVVFEYEDPTSVHNASSSTFTLYPNPANDVVSIELDSPKPITVTDVAGQIIRRVNSESTNVTIPTSDWSPGAYYVRTTTATKMIVVQR